AARALIPALPAVHSEMARRRFPQSPLLDLGAQRSPQLLQDLPKHPGIRRLTAGVERTDIGREDPRPGIGGRPPPPEVAQSAHGLPIPSHLRPAFLPPSRQIRTTHR